MVFPHLPETFTFDLHRSPKNSYNSPNLIAGSGFLCVALIPCFQRKPIDRNPFNILRMIEVFRTNIDLKSQAKIILSALRRNMPGTYFHFDLEDCDRILVARGEPLDVDNIVSIVRSKGMHCEVLED